MKKAPVHFDEEQSGRRWKRSQLPIVGATSYGVTPYGVRKHITEIKDAVPVEDYAQDFTQLKRVGSSARLEGRCPLPDHDDRTPSFNVYPETSSWHCFGCQASGDVLDLYTRIEGASEVWEAVVGLSQRFGVEV